MTRTLRYGGIVLTGLLLAAALKVFVLDAVAIASRSMEPEILEGDCLLLDKTGYSPAAASFRIPSRGDIIAFRLNGSLILKRCVATAGDTVWFDGASILVNGGTVAAGVGEAGPYLPSGVRRPLPRRGDIIRLDSSNCALWGDLIAAEGHSLGKGADGGMLLDGSSASTYTVQDDYLFVMGDNHSLSMDSRTWGPVPARSVVGKAFLVYWSSGGDGAVRWERIGELLP